MKFSVLAKWFNAINEAHNRGEINAFTDDGKSIAVQWWCAAFKKNGEDAADAVVVRLAQAWGVSLKRHKPT